MDELFDVGTRSAEELERQQMAAWVTELVKAAAKKVDDKVEAIKHVNQSVQVTILDLGAIRSKLRDLGIGWEDVKTDITYSDNVGLRVTLGDLAFREFYKTLGGLPLEPYTTSAQVRIKVTKRTELIVRAESLTKEAFERSPVKPSLTDDLPF